MAVHTLLLSNRTWSSPTSCSHHISDLSDLLPAHIKWTQSILCAPTADALWPLDLCPSCDSKGKYQATRPSFTNGLSFLQITLLRLLLWFCFKCVLVCIYYRTSETPKEWSRPLIHSDLLFTFVFLVFMFLLTYDAVMLAKKHVKSCIIYEICTKRNVIQLSIKSLSSFWSQWSASCFLVHLVVTTAWLRCGIADVYKHVQLSLTFSCPWPPALPLQDILWDSVASHTWQPQVYVECVKPLQTWNLYSAQTASDLWPLAVC